MELGERKQNEGWSEQVATKDWSTSKFLNIKKGLTSNAGFKLFINDHCTLCVG